MIYEFRYQVFRTIRLNAHSLDEAKIYMDRLLSTERTSLGVFDTRPISIVPVPLPEGQPV